MNFIKYIVFLIRVIEYGALQARLSKLVTQAHSLLDVCRGTHRGTNPPGV